MEQIKSIIKDVIGGIQEKQENNSCGDIESAWVKSAKKRAAQYTKIRFLKAGKLYVNVKDSAWLYELNSKKKDILKRIKKITKNKITDIRFKVGDIYGD